MSTKLAFHNFPNLEKFLNLNLTKNREKSWDLLKMLWENTLNADARSISLEPTTSFLHCWSLPDFSHCWVDTSKTFRRNIFHIFWPHSRFYLFVQILYFTFVFKFNIPPFTFSTFPARQISFCQLSRVSEIWGWGFQFPPPLSSIWFVHKLNWPLPHFIAPKISDQIDGIVLERTSLASFAGSVRRSFGSDALVRFPDWLEVGPAGSRNLTNDAPQEMPAEISSDFLSFSKWYSSISKTPKCNSSISKTPKCCK